MTLIDSHAHLTSDSLYDQIDPILERAKENGLSSIVNICTDKETLSRGISLVKKYPWIVNTAATTPHDVEKEGESFFPIVEACAKRGDLVAIGETGLDYHYNYSDKKIQRDFLCRYLHLAIDTLLPVVIHCREAFSDLFSILDAEYTVDGKLALGVLHCFTGTVEEAEEVLKRGWLLSLSGIVTFKKSEALREVAKLTPLDQLLIETDSPYLAPQSKRGKMNEPAYIKETAELIASLKGIPVEEVMRATAENARRLFRLKG